MAHNTKSALLYDTLLECTIFSERIIIIETMSLNLLISLYYRIGHYFRPSVTIS